jgi:hypothetical protein
MRLTRICFAAALLLGLPIIGNVQQAPGAATTTRPASALSELQALVKTQTEAIQALHAKVVDLEARVEKLEKRKPGPDSQ